METVLHVEPITRQVPVPLTIGHSEHIFYGDRLTEDGEFVGDTISSLLLGAPLQTCDDGLHSQTVPLLKTIGYQPDFRQPKDNVYTETLYYRKGKELIPFRSKTRNKIGESIRTSHLPSLNLVRQEIVPYARPIQDPRTEIMNDALLRDHIFQENRNQLLQDWVTHDLSNAIDRKPYNLISFDVDQFSSLVPKFVDQIRGTPFEFSVGDLQNIAESIFPIAPCESMIASDFVNNKPVILPLADMRHRVVNNGFDFGSYGNIDLRRFDRIESNPRHFQNICEWIDSIPLTDFNVDLVVDPDNYIVYYNEIFATDRFTQFADNLARLPEPGWILRQYIDPTVLSEIIARFIKYHGGVGDRMMEYINTKPVKLKFLKTLNDEAAILLYAYDSTSDEPPLCGVYFDIALMSLAPLSILETPMVN